MFISYVKVTKLCASYARIQCPSCNAPQEKLTRADDALRASQHLVLCIPERAHSRAPQVGGRRHEKIAACYRYDCCADRGECRAGCRSGTACERAHGCAAAGVELVRLLRRTQCRLCAQHDRVE